MEDRKRELEQAIAYSVRETNILPITSRCDASCVFCSHKNNPPEVRVLSVGVRPYDDIIRDFIYLNPDQPITIGESATLIMEGEPFTHPEFGLILKSLRNAFPYTPIAVTTNGHHLNRETVEMIRDLGNITLSISMNSASSEGRALLMGDSPEVSEKTMEGIGLLGHLGVGFESSLVAMPNLTGWGDLKNTIEFLAKNNASVVRVFMPAFGDRAKKEDFPDPDNIHGQLKDFIRKLDMSCPVLLEPSWVRDLAPEISGITKNSPAWLAGVRRGDTFTEINGGKPRCRLEAWQMVMPKGPITAKLRRGNELLEVQWENLCDGGSGITMEYDFDMERAASMQMWIDRCPGKTLALCSEFAFEVLRAVFALLEIPEEKAEIFMVKNRTFGGSIKAAGLLAVDDFLQAYQLWRKENDAPMQILLPGECINAEGYDLTGKHITQIREITGVPIVVQ